MEIEMTKPEVADIFRIYKYDYEQNHPLSQRLKKTIQSIINCRTAELGGHVQKCTRCGHEEQSYNSCRDRHCPKCQYSARMKWIYQRKSEVLPVKYFHIVFTIPDILNRIALCNKKIVYNILFIAAFYTIKQFALNPRWMGGIPGGMAILHTWGQNLSFHPHIHIAIPAGGLSEDKTEWMKTHAKFFAPVKAMSIIFAKKFIQLLNKEQNNSNYKQVENQDKDIAIAEKKSWVVYAKKPFSSPEHVIDYFGNYTHRVAISNFRLIKLEHHKVWFHYKDYKNGGEKKVISMDVFEFIRRFLLHVLPYGFYKIRYFGFLSNRNKKENIEKATEVLERINYKQKPETKIITELETFMSELQKYFTPCPKCKGIMLSGKRLAEYRQRKRLEGT